MALQLTKDERERISPMRYAGQRLGCRTPGEVLSPYFPVTTEMGRCLWNCHVQFCRLRGMIWKARLGAPRSNGEHEPGRDFAAAAVSPGDGDGLHSVFWFASRTWSRTSSTRCAGRRERPQPKIRHRVGGKGRSGKLGLDERIPLDAHGVFLAGFSAQVGDVAEKPGADSHGQRRPLLRSAVGIVERQFDFVLRIGCQVEDTGGVLVVPRVDRAGAEALSCRHAEQRHCLAPGSLADGTNAHAHPAIAVFVPLDTSAARTCPCTAPAPPAWMSPELTPATVFMHQGFSAASDGTVSPELAPPRGSLAAALRCGERSGARPVRPG
jgi:hypothetical protein